LKPVMRAWSSQALGHASPLHHSSGNAVSRLRSRFDDHVAVVRARQSCVVMKRPTVYLLASRPRGALYVGVTPNLARRARQHCEGSTPGFTRRFGVKRLVWYELHPTMRGAIAREKALKKWQRRWKLELIERTNPDWRDLWAEITGGTLASAEPAVRPHGNQAPDDRIRFRRGPRRHWSELPHSTE
jgi:putative endonuclease